MRWSAFPDFAPSPLRHSGGLLLAIFALALAAAACAGTALGAELTVSGRVTDAQTGEGVAGIHILAFKANYGYIYISSTDDDGFYSGSADVEDGEYRLHTRAQSQYSYFDEVFPEIRCVIYCPDDAGTPFVVSGAQAFSGIDFALDLGGRIEVTVSSDATHLPLDSATVVIWNGATPVHVAYSAYAAGTIRSDVLPAGNYKVYAIDAPGHLSELFNDRPCGDTCNPLAGDNLAVSAGTTTTIAMSLKAGVSLSGRLTDPLGNPVQASIVVYKGTQQVSSGSTTADGVYTTVGTLAPGSYVVMAQHPFFVNTLYPQTSCAACDPFTTGAPVVLGNQSISGLDMVLQPGGRIIGDIFTYENTLGPSPSVEIYTLDGTRLSWIWSEGVDEGYAFSGIPAGTYRALIRSYPEGAYVTSVYPGLPCYLDGVCDISAGTTFQVLAGQTTSGIDFEFRADALFRASLD